MFRSLHSSPSVFHFPPGSLSLPFFFSECNPVPSVGFSSISRRHIASRAKARQNIRGRSNRTSSATTHSNWQDHLRWATNSGGHKRPSVRERKKKRPPCSEKCRASLAALVFVTDECEDDLVVCGSFLEPRIRKCIHSVREGSAREQDQDCQVRTNKNAQTPNSRLIETQGIHTRSKAA